MLVKKKIQKESYIFVININVKVLQKVSRINFPGLCKVLKILIIALFRRLIIVLFFFSLITLILNNIQNCDKCASVMYKNFKLSKYFNFLHGIIILNRDTL